MMKEFNKTKVVTKNEFADWFEGIKNFLGLRLKGYEELIDNTIKELLEETGEKKWFRVSINELANRSIMITVYGELK